MTRPNTAEIFTAQIPALKLLKTLGYDYISPLECSALRGGNQNVVLKTHLIEVLKTRTFEYKGQRYPISNNAIDQIVRELTAPRMQDGLIPANEAIYNKLIFGITVTEFVDGKTHSPTIPIIDWNDPSQNHFAVTEEFDVLKVDGIKTRRPDIVCFVNGLPLVVIEAKRPDSGNPNTSMMDEGISQSIRNQKPDEIPHLFAYSQLLLAINGTDGRYGTAKTPKKFWAKWREEILSDEDFDRIKNTPAADNTLLDGRGGEVREQMQAYFSAPQLVTEQDRLIISLLSPDRLLDFIRNFIFFDRKLGKIAARYQQVFGIKALLARISETDDKGTRNGGVIWHTTGSGKSFTMVLLCKALLMDEALAQSRIIVVTDRLDLEKQLSRTFASSGVLGRKGKPSDAKAKSGRDLAKRIGKGKERILFSTVQRFSSAVKSHEAKNDSANLIVLIDEGHRSHSGESHERMRLALPKAAFIAFTGTPLLKKNKTENKFGPIVHPYSMQRAVEDGTVTPLLYEERRPVLDVNESAIDNWFDKITSDLTPEQQNDLKQKYAKRGQIYGSLNRIELIAWDIALHFEANFKSLKLGLKGQLATDSKLSAVRYKKALDATGKVSSAVIISPPDTREGHQDVDESEVPEVQQWWKDNVKTDAEDYERQVLEDFSEPGAPDILIVVDKLLTGFDEPANAVLYIDKPLKEHNLVQAIARVNRLHEQKKHGLLIDYRGILKELDTALTEYRDLAEKTQSGFEIADIEGLYSDIATEYKKLPGLHKTLLKIFEGVQNKADREQYRQVLIPQLVDRYGEVFDERQKTREDFYEALTEFGMCLKVALGSRSFFEDKSFPEKTIAMYKRDLKFFSEIRRTAKQDAEETVDYSTYEGQLVKLIDKHIIGEKIIEPQGVLLVNELAKEGDAVSWTEEKTRNETELIQSRLTRTIEQELAVDPYAQAHFSELLRNALDEAAALFEHPYKHYALFKEIEDQIESRTSLGIPDKVKGNPHASAYFGLLKMTVERNQLSWNENEFAELSIELDKQVTQSVAENSLNPSSIENSIKKSVLPLLFKVIGLDNATEVTNRIVDITRLGIARGTR